MIIKKTKQGNDLKSIGLYYYYGYAINNINLQINKMATFYTQKNCFWSYFLYFVKKNLKYRINLLLDSTIAVGI